MLDVSTFPTIVRSTVPRASSLEPRDVRTILQIAYLTAEIDLDEDPDELELLKAAGQMLWEFAGYAPEDVPIVSPLPLPIDQEARRARVLELVSELTSREARELAYTIAYLFTVEDLYLAPVESELLDDLRHGLGIERDRATELITTAATIVTPGASDLQPT
jgi:hypothetical protein